MLNCRVALVNRVKIVIAGSTTYCHRYCAHANSRGKFNFNVFPDITRMYLSSELIVKHETERVYIKFKFEKVAIGQKRCRFLVYNFILLLAFSLQNEGVKSIFRQALKGVRSVYTLLHWKNMFYLSHFVPPEQKVTHAITLSLELSARSFSSLCQMFRFLSFCSSMCAKIQRSEQNFAQKRGCKRRVLPAAGFYLLSQEKYADCLTCLDRDYSRLGMCDSHGLFSLSILYSKLMAHNIVTCSRYVCINSQSKSLQKLSTLRSFRRSSWGKNLWRRIPDKYKNLPQLVFYFSNI